MTYTKAILDIITLEVEDIITTSGTGGNLLPPENAIPGSGSIEPGNGTSTPVPVPDDGAEETPIM